MVVVDLGRGGRCLLSFSTYVDFRDNFLLCNKDIHFSLCVKVHFYMQNLWCIGCIRVYVVKKLTQFHYMDQVNFRISIGNSTGSRAIRN